MPDTTMICALQSQARMEALCSEVQTAEEKLAQVQGGVAALAAQQAALAAEAAAAAAADGATDASEIHSNRAADTATAGAAATNSATGGVALQQRNAALEAKLAALKAQLVEESAEVGRLLTDNLSLVFEIARLNASVDASPSGAKPFHSSASNEDGAQPASRKAGHADREASCRACGGPLGEDGDNVACCASGEACDGEDARARRSSGDWADVAPRRFSFDNVHADTAAPPGEVAAAAAGGGGAPRQHAASGTASGGGGGGGGYRPSGSGVGSGAASRSPSGSAPGGSPGRYPSEGGRSEDSQSGGLPPSPDGECPSCRRLR